tara:strand:+ start:610 stop:1917 length:1308 start_codon:yes stop_codon:yes gene_type:complete
MGLLMSTLVSSVEIDDAGLTNRTNGVSRFLSRIKPKSLDRFLNSDNLEKITSSRVIKTAKHIASAAALGQVLKYGLSAGTSLTGTTTIAAVGAAGTSTLMTAWDFHKNKEQKIWSKEFLKTAGTRAGSSAAIAAGFSEALELAGAIIPEGAVEKLWSSIKETLSGFSLFGQAHAATLEEPVSVLPVGVESPIVNEPITEQLDEDNVGPDEPEEVNIASLKTALIEHISNQLENGALPEQDAQKLIDSIENGTAQDIKDNAFRLFNGFDCFTQNQQMALKVYELAASMGNEQAISDLSYIQHYGLAGVEQNAEVALNTMQTELSHNKEQSFDRWEITEEEKYSSSNACDSKPAISEPEIDNNEPPLHQKPVTDFTRPLVIEKPAVSKIPESLCPDFSAVWNKIWDSYETPSNAQEKYCVKDAAESLREFQKTQPGF